MKKITDYFIYPLSLLLKLIIAIMMGISSSMGKKPIETEKKNSKIIEAKK